MQQTGINGDRPSPELLDQFTAESLFSHRLPEDSGRPGGPVADVVHRGKQLEFYQGRRRFVRLIPGDDPLPPEYRPSWTRFLVIQCSIHPTIRDQIVRTGLIPKLLQFSYFDAMESCTMTYRLESVSEGPDRWVGIPLGFTPKVFAGDRLGCILAKLDPKDWGTTLRTRPATERFIDEALVRGDALDAYLGWAEYTALTGDNAARRESKDRLFARILAAQDERVLSLEFAQGKPEQWEAIQKTIDEIDRRGLKKGYQLDVCRSFFLTGLGRAVDADDCLLKAIEANPHLLNCYQRLGDDHLRAFDTVDAWRCFDAIRRIDPDYFMLSNVNELEARYQKDFPDDF